jgi:hypothetical protein
MIETGGRRGASGAPGKLMAQPGRAEDCESFRMQVCHHGQRPDANRRASSGATDVFVMQAADHRNGFDVAVVVGDNGTHVWRILAERQVRPRRVIVRNVFAQDTHEMALAQDDDAVEALAANGADHPLAIRILPWRSWSGLDLFDAHGVNALDEVRAVDAIVVAEQKPRRGIDGEGVDDLLCSPARVGMLSDIEMYDAPAVVSQDDEHVQDTKCCGWYDKKVDGGQIAEVVLQKRTPGLRRRLATTGHEARNGGLGDNEPQLRKLAVDTRCTPRWVVVGHATDEVTELAIGAGSTGLVAAFPCPEKLEAFAVPSDHGLGLDDDKRLSPVGESTRHGNPERPVGPHEARAIGAAFEHCQLLAQRQVLQGKVTLRSDCRSDGTGQGKEYVEHGDRAA